MRLSDFDYDLPNDLIARYPLANRSASRLLCLEGATGDLSHRHFVDLPHLLNEKDLLVLNNTRVIPARLFGHKETGGQVEVLVERILDSQHLLAHVRASKPLKPHSYVYFDRNVRFEMLSKQDDLIEFRSESPEPLLDILDQIGQVPLPPYFQREAEESDKVNYQTIYAEHKGSVAAPTAGLHFNIDLMQSIKEKGIQVAYLTLHVGAGTFAPVRVDNITEHRMHSEYIEVSEALAEKIRETKARGGRIVAVGTTSARSLETASLSGQIKAFSGETDIFIYPGFHFQCVDVLITNFHAPKSSLLMLVSAFAGYDAICKAYQTAIEAKYRFLSYGDAMFITRKPS
jgi:S-adenosylmethionine:tRNA ribosyltransferase-isomerase